MNWANRLTISRLVLTVLFVAMLNLSWGYARTTAFILFLIAGLTTGCTVGPDYKRPIVTLPDSYRGAAAPEPAAADAVSIGDQAWWDVFQDDQLRKLIQTALQQVLPGLTLPDRELSDPKKDWPFTAPRPPERCCGTSGITSRRSSTAPTRTRPITSSAR